MMRIIMMMVVMIIIIMMMRRMEMRMEGMRRIAVLMLFAISAETFWKKQLYATVDK